METQVFQYGGSPGQSKSVIKAIKDNCLLFLPGF